MQRVHRLFLVVLGINLLMALCPATTADAHPERQSRPSAYRGIALPQPPSVAGVTTQPPPAWLIVGKKATAASYGGFCYMTSCVDMIPPAMRPDLATARASRAARPFVVIRSSVVRHVHVTLSPWSADGTPAAAGRTIGVTTRQDGTWTVVGLTLVGSLRNQLLTVAVTFRSGGDASYVWRLNPAS